MYERVNGNICMYALSRGHPVHISNTRTGLLPLVGPAAVVAGGAAAEVGDPASSVATRTEDACRTAVLWSCCRNCSAGCC